MSPVKRRISKTDDYDKDIAEAEARGAEKMLRNLERVIAGEEPDLITLDKIRAGRYSDEELIRRKPEVDAALEAGE